MAKRDFLGVYERCGNFFGSRKNRDIFGYCTLSQLKSTMKSVQFTLGVGFIWVHG